MSDTKLLLALVRTLSVVQCTWSSREHECTDQTPHQSALAGRKLKYPRISRVSFFNKPWNNVFYCPETKPMNCCCCFFQLLPFRVATAALPLHISFSICLQIAFDILWSVKRICCTCCQTEHREKKKGSKMIDSEIMSYTSFKASKTTYHLHLSRTLINNMVPFSARGFPNLHESPFTG